MENYNFIESGIIFGLCDAGNYKQFGFGVKDFVEHADAYLFIQDHIDEYKEFPKTEVLLEKFNTLKPEAFVSPVISIINSNTISNIEIITFIKYLSKIGYLTKNLKNNQKTKLFKSFQRRFRQKLINGKIDKECLIIADKMSKLIK